MQLILAVSLILMTGAASAQVADIGDMASSLQTQAGDIADLIGAAAFLLGICIGIVGLMKFRQHSQNPNDPSARLSTAFTLVFVRRRAGCDSHHSWRRCRFAFRQRRNQCFCGRFAAQHQLAATRQC